MADHGGTWWNMVAYGGTLRNRAEHGGTWTKMAERVRTFLSYRSYVSGDRKYFIHIQL